MDGEVRVRTGDKTDLPAVFALVKELAAFERAAKEVVTSAEVYERDFDDGCFELLIAEDVAGAVVGMMLFYPAYSTWKGRMLYLEDFVVSERGRRRGVGSALWARLVERGYELKCALLKWQVLDWNESAIAFYERAGAKLESEWLNGTIYLHDRHSKQYVST